MLARLHVSVSYFWGDLLLLKIVVYIFYSLARLYPYITVHHKLGFCARAPEFPLRNSTQTRIYCSVREKLYLICFYLISWLHAMSSEDKTPYFAPLNDTNFHEWSIRIEAQLI